MFLHRCLQHTKKDIKDACVARVVVSKNPRRTAPRLREPQLGPKIIEWVEFAAWLPKTLEFHVFWTSVLTRMKSDKAPTDFNEPHMAAYLVACVLDCEGPFIRASWACGFGSFVWVSRRMRQIASKGVTVR